MEFVHHHTPLVSPEICRMLLIVKQDPVQNEKKKGKQNLFFLHIYFQQYLDVYGSTMFRCLHVSIHLCETTNRV